MQIFGDKGIYPIETVYGVFSVTATLTKKKLDNALTNLWQYLKNQNLSILQIMDCQEKQK